MGINGLIKYLNSNIQLNNENITSNTSFTTLLIDSNGFLFRYFVNSNILTNNLYNQLIKDIKKDIDILLNLNIKLKFYFDGKQTRFKKETKLKRKYKIFQKWDNLNNLLNKKKQQNNKNNNNKQQDLNDLPLPHLCFIQFKIILMEMNQEILLFDEECDQIMAKDCYQLNQAGEKAYCYTNDRLLLLFNYFI